MKKALHEITVSQFIDILCGDISSLCVSNEINSIQKASETVNSLVHEYRSIADPGGEKAYLINTDAYNKEKARFGIYAICDFLVELGQFDKVREILSEEDPGDEDLTDDRVKAVVKSRLGRARIELAKIEERKPAQNEESDIRKDFELQAASLMAYFRFQIDMETMKASVFAHLVARCNREIKAKMAAVKK